MNEIFKKKKQERYQIKNLVEYEKKEKKSKCKVRDRRN